MAEPILTKIIDQESQQLRPFLLKIKSRPCMAEFLENDEKLRLYPKLAHRNSKSIVTHLSMPKVFSLLYSFIFIFHKPVLK